MTPPDFISPDKWAGFDAFWAAWPGNGNGYTRKGCKAECLKRWKARHHETQAGQIVKHVEWMKTTADWLKDGGAFIPAPLVYLNQQRWDGADIPVNGPRTDFDKWKAKAEEWTPADPGRVAELVARAKGVRRVA